MTAARPSRTTSTVVARYRGRTRLALIRDLAMGEWTHEELARTLGVGVREIHAFADANEAEIAEVSAALAGRLALETAGLWVAKKQNRISELQAMYEDNEMALTAMRGGSHRPENSIGSRKHFNLTRLQLAILAAVGGELEPRRGVPGQAQTDSKVVHYIIEGSETDALT